MLWSFHRPDPGAERAERARREHGRWLSAAMRCGRPLSRIPVRAVRDGGFGALASDPAQRAWVEVWWSETLELSDLDL